MSAAVLLAALSAGAAAWVVCARDEVLRRARTLLGGGPEARGTPGGLLGPVGIETRLSGLLEPFRVRFGWRLGREVLLLPGGLVAGLAAGSVLPVLLGAAAVPLAGRGLRERERRAEAERRAVAVGALCAAVAGDLRAGLAPPAALAGALGREGWPERPGLSDAALPLLAAARFAGDVPAALLAAARLEGAEGLSGVAACWRVAMDGGAGLADGLDRIAAALRAERDQREDLRAQLAAPRSTVALLALLPVFGLVLGTGLGADPLGTLLRTPAGLGCLAAGGSLEWAGLAWTARIVRTAEGGS
ncbi:type II secretion system F family protein [Actinacidiphila sp. bgisy160]|uniref:type II secretion system F family protein n=1 Tax=Actinacidiphila sp. bgisy160 TaxID=3413796 RepID=UPI003D763469